MVIATAHASVNYRELADWARCIVDTRNAMAAVQTAPGRHDRITFGVHCPSLKTYELAGL